MYEGWDPGLYMAYWGTWERFLEPSVILFPQRLEGRRAIFFEAFLESVKG